MATSNHQMDSDKDLNFKVSLRENLEKFTRLRDDVIQEVDHLANKMRRDTESVINLQAPSADDIEAAQRILDAASIVLRECYKKVCDCKILTNSPSWDINKKLLDHNCQNFADEHRKLESKVSIFAEQQSKSQGEFESRINFKYQSLEDITQLRNSLNQSENIRLELRINKMEQNFQKQLEGLSKELLDCKLSTSANQDKGNYSNLTTGLVNMDENSRRYNNLTQENRIPERVKLQSEESIAGNCQDLSTMNPDGLSAVLNDEHQKLRKEILQKAKENCKKAGEKYATDIEAIRKNNQKERSKLLNATKQVKKMDLDLKKLEQKFQDLESKTDFENNNRQNVNGLNEKVEDNSHDIARLWEMLEDRKAMEDNLFAEIDTIKHIQIDDENDNIQSIGTVVGKLNFAMEALDVQVEKIKDKLADLHVKLHRGEEAFSILTADAGLDSSMNKDDLAAAVREMGTKYMLMEGLVSKRVDHLEILRRNLEVANKTVTRRKDLEKEVAALKDSLSHLQTKISANAKFSFGNMLNLAGPSTTTFTPRFTLPKQNLTGSSTTTAVTLPSENKAVSSTATTAVPGFAHSTQSIAGLSTPNAPAAIRFTASRFTFSTQSLTGSSTTTAVTLPSQNKTGSSTAPAAGSTLSTQSLAGLSTTNPGFAFSSQN